MLFSHMPASNIALHASAEEGTSEVFRIKNISAERYLSSSTSDNGASVYKLEMLDTENASQYFKFEKTPSGETILTSADSNAEYCLSFSNSEDRSNAQKIEKKTALPVILTEKDDGIYEITVTDGAKTHYLSADNAGYIFFAENLDASSGWKLEEVIPESFTAAYFEMRMKLYSVERLFVNIKPAALASFINWSTDNENILLASDNGTLCALSEGVSTVRASLGGYKLECRVEVYDKNAFTWFSQTNVNNSYWNGGALGKIKFKTRLFASETKKNWMDQGCAISSVAMIFRNMGATYKNGYDFRSGQNGNLPADPYTVALANVGYKGFTGPSGSYYADPVYTRWSTVTNAFTVNGSSLTYTHKYSGNPITIKNSLLKNPEGLVVQMTKATGETHYIVIAECLNPNEKNASKLKFIVYDPLGYDKNEGDGVLFEESASYKLGYRYSDFTSYYCWDVK